MTHLILGSSNGGNISLYIINQGVRHLHFIEFVIYILYGLFLKHLICLAFVKCFICIFVQTQRLNEVKREEYELLEAQSIPLRNYLMQHVMPTLTQGLIECCKVRPDDAIDYLVG